MKVNNYIICLIKVGNEPTFYWKLYEFTQKGILEKGGRGKYKLGEMKIFKQILNEEIIEIYQKVSSQFPQNLEILSVFVVSISPFWMN